MIDNRLLADIARVVHQVNAGVTVEQVREDVEAMA